MKSYRKFKSLDYGPEGGGGKKAQMGWTVMWATTTWMNAGVPRSWQGENISIFKERQFIG